MVCAYSIRDRQVTGKLRYCWCSSDDQPSRASVVIENSRGKSAFCVLFEEFHRVADGEDRLGGIIGDFAAEFLLECHDELNGIETVSPEIINEACVLGHLVGFNAQMLDDNLFNPLADVTHRCTLVSISIELDRSAPPRRFAIGLVSVRAWVTTREPLQAVSGTPVITLARSISPP